MTELVQPLHEILQEIAQAEITQGELLSLLAELLRMEADAPTHQHAAALPATPPTHGPVS